MTCPVSPDFVPKPKLFLKKILLLNFYSEVIIDAHLFVKIMERDMYTLDPVSPNGNSLQNWSAASPSGCR